jgi:hypothetical protein
LAVAPQTSFASRYADPNHPANSGSLISLVTGGAYNPNRRERLRRRLGRSGIAGRVSRRGRDEKTSGKRRKGVVRRALKKVSSLR